MEMLLLKGKIFAESIENAILKTCYEQDIPVVYLEGKEQEILDRCLNNTEVKLSEEAYNEIYTDIFYLLKSLEEKQKTGSIKEKIAAVFVADQEEPSKLEETLGKADGIVDDVIGAVEKGKEIYEKASPLVKLALLAIKKIPVFFK